MRWLLLSTRQAVSCKSSRHFDSMSHLITSQSSLNRKKCGSSVCNYLDLGKIQYPSEVPVFCWVTRPTFLSTSCKGGKHTNLIHFINSNPTTGLLFFPPPYPPFLFKECLGSYLCDNKEKWYSACGSRASCNSLALPEWLDFYMVLIKFFLLSLASSRVLTEHW